MRKPIERWCKNFSKKYENLHESCAEVLGVTRIFFSNDKNRIKQLKLNNEHADKLLGLPMVTENEKFSIPKKDIIIFLIIWKEF